MPERGAYVHVSGVCLCIRLLSSPLLVCFLPHRHSELCLKPKPSWPLHMVLGELSKPPACSLQKLHHTHLDSISFCHQKAASSWHPLAKCPTTLLLVYIQPSLKVLLSDALWSGYQSHAFSQWRQRELSQDNNELSYPYRKCTFGVSSDKYPCTSNMWLSHKVVISFPSCPT